MEAAPVHEMFPASSCTLFSCKSAELALSSSSFSPLILPCSLQILLCHAAISLPSFLCFCLTCGAYFGTFGVTVSELAGSFLQKGKL